MSLSQFSENFTILLFHYDGRTSEWDEFEWSKKAIHVSAIKQTKWWFAKRFLHHDIVAPYEYVTLVKKHGLEISQPDAMPVSLRWHLALHMAHDSGMLVYFMFLTVSILHLRTDPKLSPLLQNDLVDGWGLDFSLRRCVEEGHERMGLVDSQCIIHREVPSLKNQVLARCKAEPEQMVARVLPRPHLVGMVHTIYSACLGLLFWSHSIYPVWFAKYAGAALPVKPIKPTWVNQIPRFAQLIGFAQLIKHDRSIEPNLSMNSRVACEPIDLLTQTLAVSLQACRSSRSEFIAYLYHAAFEASIFRKKTNLCDQEMLLGLRLATQRRRRLSREARALLERGYHAAFEASIFRKKTNLRDQEMLLGLRLATQRRRWLSREARALLERGFGCQQRRGGTVRSGAAPGDTGG
ncbi:hypothetical protein ZIOFF_043564 [Zingiber officinale]|uniref:Uncharacterized protein n=1 Tax=Zingiber officinale TaxID=94328 RepID=A0A8J5FV68_ZINOF|nr:hypothetical protein ZIOFF_043564 [Zingiber officinale]